MRYLYSLCLYLLSPWILFRIYKKSRNNSQYKLSWHQRFGYKLTNNCSKPIIWIHAVSLGETRALAKLVEIITTNYPQYQLLLTHTTLTGKQSAHRMYPQAILHYIPYDFPHAINNFLKTFNPKIGLIMETEIWPNLIYYAKYHKLPLYLINARLGTKSFNNYLKLKWWFRPIINQFTGIICQDENSKARFNALGYSAEIIVSGNIKFDVVDNTNRITVANFLNSKTKHKKIIAFASTQDGEEQLIINALPKNFDYIVLLIPRHPERFTNVRKLLTGFNYQLRSTNEPIEASTQILFGDSIGEMPMYYTLADITVMGGSFVKTGGHNIIEPIYFASPVIFGPYMFNFREIAKNAISMSAGVQVTDINQCMQQITELLHNSNKYNILLNNGKDFINKYQGASLQTLNLIKHHL
jgi:3-deoxy-D-manno-octulosonic-acid transferase